MEPNYHYAESTIKPQSVEINKTTAYLRKDFAEENRVDEQGKTIVYWVYQEAGLTLDEFNSFVSAAILKNAENEKSDRLAMMEAIAELYGIVANKAIGG